MVSVIVPVYNVEKYLSDCIESIIRQTYSDLEIILVDDGSTDNSGSICGYYECVDTRIKVYHKINGGLSDARNYGIKKSHGDEIILVDSDDVIADNMIEVLYSLKVQYNAEMSVCFRKHINEEGGFIQTGEKDNEKLVIYSSNSTEESFKIYFESKGGGMVAWGKLYDKDLFNGIEYPVGRYNEDVFTTYRLIAKCSRIAITSQRLYYYRIRNGSIMNRKFEKKHMDVIFGNIEMTSYIEDNYPKLSVFPRKLLIYTILSTALKMIKGGVFYCDSLLLMKRILSKYRHEFSAIGLSSKAKLFAFILLHSPVSLLSISSKIIGKI